jgi:hypothetical protein
MGVCTDAVDAEGIRPLRLPSLVVAVVVVVVVVVGVVCVSEFGDEGGDTNPTFAPPLLTPKQPESPYPRGSFWEPCIL